MQILLFSAIAGIVGMGLGGLASVVLLRRSSENMTCWLLSFAAGVMVSIVCFGLVPATMAITGVAVSMIGLLLGILAILVLSRVVDRMTASQERDPNIHRTPEELHHEGPILHNRTKMLRAGTIMFVAISLHNIPEGIAIGAGGSHDAQLGLLLTLMIALHNIPEGMAIAAPLLAGGIHRWTVVGLTALSGATTLLGGIVGVLVGGISPVAIALSLSMAGGAMLYVVFGEIIPQTVVMTKNRQASLITLLGMMVGLLISRL